MPDFFVKNDDASRDANHVQVIPLTGELKRYTPAKRTVIITGNASKTIADQIVTASGERLSGRPGFLNCHDLRGVNFVLRLRLELASN
jgi:hypothetical protein